MTDELRIPGLLRQMLVQPRQAEAPRRARLEHDLRRLLCHAYAHVPLYRAHWQAAGFDPRDFGGLNDLGRIPPVDKDLIVTAGAAARDSRPTAEPLDVMRTSGTSGRAIEFVRARRELRVTRRSVLRHMLWNGLRPWHRVLTMASGWLKTRRGVVVQALVKTRHVEPSTPLDEQIRALDEFRPDALVGQTGGIYLLARELLRRGRSYPMRWIVPTGATLMAPMRAVMRNAFGAEPRDMYGTIEVGPIAWQCGQGNYHLDADRLVVEVLDAQGRPARPGAAGQVVVTNVYGWVQPFIRYRLADVAVLAPHACTCRCRLPLLESVQGRVNDFLATPTGELVSPHFFFHIFDAAPRNPVRDWRVTQESATRLRFEYVPEERCDPRSLAEGVQRIRERFGPQCEVEVRAVERLALSPAGKQQCIVSLLPQGRPGLATAPQAS